MNEDLKHHLKLINKRIDKLATESFAQNGFDEKTARLRFLSELVREQVQADSFRQGPPQSTQTTLAPIR